MQKIYSNKITSFELNLEDTLPKDEEEQKMISTDEIGRIL